MATRGIYITSFGDRPGLDGLLMNIKSVTDLPVRIMNEDNCMMRWQGSPRWGQRNSDLHKSTAVFKGEFDTILILDDDMRIVNPGFEEGFELAERFGVCLPLNPRMFAYIDALIGADVSPATKMIICKDGLPAFSTAVNMGTIFVDTKNEQSSRLFLAYRQIMLTNPCRGPVAMWLALWWTGFAPYILAPQWCLCASNINQTCRHGTIKIPPIILHVGHPEVMRWYNEDDIFKEYRDAEVVA